MTQVYSGIFWLTPTRYAILGKMCKNWTLIVMGHRLLLRKTAGGGMRSRVFCLSTHLPRTLSPPRVRTGEVRTQRISTLSLHQDLSKLRDVLRHTKELYRGAGWGTRRSDPETTKSSGTRVRYSARCPVLPSSSVAVSHLFWECTTSPVKREICGRLC